MQIEIGSRYCAGMETVRVNVGCERFAGALEAALAQSGFLTRRSFDLSLAAPGTSCGPPGASLECRPNTCACRYAVIIVQLRPKQTGTATIAILGRGESSVVTLMTWGGDSEFAALFTPLVIQALRLSKASTLMMEPAPAPQTRNAI